MKTCPFAQRDCDNTCPLYVSPEDLNEFVSARLSSIGVIGRSEGECSLRMLALCQSRIVFENTKSRG